MIDTIQPGGHRIAFEQRGEGPPIVFLHGYVGDQRTWRRQLEDLSDEFTVVAGTLLAMAALRIRPTLPSAVVLAAAYAGWAGSLPTEAVEHRLQQALRLAGLPPSQLVDELLPTLFSASAPPALVSEFAAAMAEFHPAGLRANARAFAQADLRDVLPRIDVPTLLLYGDQDVRASVDVGRELQEAIRGSRIVVLDGVGHVSNVEAAERFNAEVRAFLREDAFSSNCGIEGWPGREHLASWNAAAPPATRGVACARERKQPQACARHSRSSRRRPNIAHRGIECLAEARFPLYKPCFQI